MSDKRSFFAELQRRHVYKVGAAYAVAAWLLVQIVTQVFPVFDVPALAQRVIVLAIVAGFPLALVLAWVFDVTPGGIVRTDDVADAADVETPGAARQRRSLDRRLNYALAGLLLAALAYLLADRLQVSPSGDTAAADKSVAVLPFENLSDDAANAYFAEGIQDEVLTRLAKIGALKVISRTSTRQYQSRPGNLSAIARQLGVAHVVEGSVQRSGNRVRIQVQLIRADTDSHLWAETYDRTLDDLFTVQSEVARAIATELQAKISGNERRVLAQVPTQNAAAYDAYLRALAVEGHYTQSIAELTQQTENYRRAVELDPGFVLAWAKLTEAETNLYYWYDHKPAQLQRIRAALARAQAGGAALVEVDVAEGMYYYWGVEDYPRALEAFQRAQRRLPNDAAIQLRIANVMRRQGRYEEALAAQRQAAQFDPGNSDYWFNQALTLRVLRRYDEARQACDRALQLRPGDTVLLAFKAETFQAQGDLDAAQRLLDAATPEYADPVSSSMFVQQAIYRRDYDHALALLGTALAEVQAASLPPLLQAGYLNSRGLLRKLAGQPAAASRADFQQALQLVQAQRALDDHGGVLAMNACFAHAGLGDKAAAIRECEAGVAAQAGDAFNSPQSREGYALALLYLGETERALAMLASLMSQPGIVQSTPATLRLDPAWDAVRATPAFQQLLALPP